MSKTAIQSTRDKSSELSCLRWIAKAWQGFNRWRKKYWRIRILILCLIFASPIKEFVTRDYLIVDLVRMACDMLLATSEPRVVTSLVRYHKVKEIHRLQNLLRKELDSDQNGLLDSIEAARAQVIGFDTKQLKKKAIEADLNQLAKAAVQLRLVSGLYSTKRIRQQAWYMAVGEAQAIFEPQHKKINSMLQISYKSLDYRKWETWKLGISNFVGQISYFIRSLGPPLTIGAWFLVCFLIALSISVFLPNRQRVMGLLIGIFLAEAVVLLLYKPNKMLSSFWSFDELRYWSCGISIICFSAVVGNFGGQTAAGFKKPRHVVFTAVLFIGIVLTIWGYFAHSNMNWFWLRGFPFGIPVSNSMKSGSIAIGAILGIAGTIGLYSVWRRSRVLPNKI